MPRANHAFFQAVFICDPSGDSGTGEPWELGILGESEPETYVPADPALIDKRYRVTKLCITSSGPCSCDFWIQSFILKKGAIVLFPCKEEDVMLGLVWKWV
jgi:hypothetical protein